VPARLRFEQSLAICKASEWEYTMSMGRWEKVPDPRPSSPRTLPAKRIAAGQSYGNTEDAKGSIVGYKH